MRQLSESCVGGPGPGAPGPAKQTPTVTDARRARRRVADRGSGITSGDGGSESHGMSQCVITARHHHNDVNQVPNFRSSEVQVQVPSQSVGPPPRLAQTSAPRPGSDHHHAISESCGRARRARAGGLSRSEVARPGLSGRGDRLGRWVVTSSFMLGTVTSLSQVMTFGSPRLQRIALSYFIELINCQAEPLISLTQRPEPLAVTVVPKFTVLPGFISEEPYSKGPAAHWHRPCRRPITF
jgi:hypothetical protein